MKYIVQKTQETTIYLCRYSKDVHRTKYQALTITRLTHSPYTTQIARIRCYFFRVRTQDVHEQQPYANMAAYWQSRVQS